MAQHIWVKNINNNEMYKWNFANIYNLLWANKSNFNIISWINIYWDTLVRKENLELLIDELILLKKTFKNNKEIIYFIEYINNNYDDLIFIWD